jgi:hypothetical protein
MGCIAASKGGMRVSYKIIVINFTVTTRFGDRDLHGNELVKQILRNKMCRSGLI